MTALEWYVVLAFFGLPSVALMMGLLAGLLCERWRTRLLCSDDGAGNRYWHVRPCATAARTVVVSESPFVAVDLDAAGRAVGLEECLLTAPEGGR